ncbi:hypothetical protein [Caulobacter sp. BE254]|uniref:hypothetical protein n=1 Tax=Caulobacter sp. BE254 TaxID=2817720 RepID=UPI00285BB261|nr:hypothetical protein [Caulobacter sp. BE254]MDR7115457.1 hypothetical protein [Caulobacter sp. BE254]
MTFKTLVLGVATAASTPFLTPVTRVSGNEQVIDDFAVEAPGVCHLENWATRFGARYGLVNLSPQSLATYVRGNLHPTAGGMLHRLTNHGARNCPHGNP